MPNSAVGLWGFLDVLSPSLAWTQSQCGQASAKLGQKGTNSSCDGRFHSNPSAKALGLSAANTVQSDIPAGSQTRSVQGSDWPSLATVLGLGVESVPSGPER